MVLCLQLIRGSEPPLVWVKYTKDQFIMLKMVLFDTITLNTEFRLHDPQLSKVMVKTLLNCTIKGITIDCQPGLFLEPHNVDKVSYPSPAMLHLSALCSNLREAKSHIDDVTLTNFSSNNKFRGLIALEYCNRIGLQVNSVHCTQFDIDLILQNKSKLELPLKEIKINLKVDITASGKLNQLLLVTEKMKIQFDCPIISEAFFAFMKQNKEKVETFFGSNLKSFPFSTSTLIFSSVLTSQLSSQLPSLPFYLMPNKEEKGQLEILPYLKNIKTILIDSLALVDLNFKNVDARKLILTSNKIRNCDFTELEHLKSISFLNNEFGGLIDAFSLQNISQNVVRITLEFDIDIPTNQKLKKFKKLNLPTFLKYLNCNVASLAFFNFNSCPHLCNLKLNNPRQLETDEVWDHIPQGLNTLLINDHSTKPWLDRNRSTKRFGINLKRPNLRNCEINILTSPLTNQICVNLDLPSKCNVSLFDWIRIDTSETNHLMLITSVVKGNTIITPLGYNSYLTVKNPIEQNKIIDPELVDQVCYFSKQNFMHGISGFKSSNAYSKFDPLRLFVN